MGVPKVLCVEAAKSDLEELRGSLEQAGCIVLSAESSNKALTLLASENIDGVIVDSHLRTADGIPLRNRIRHFHPDLPMLIFSDVDEIKRLPIRIFKKYITDPGPPDSVLADFHN